MGWEGAGTARAEATAATSRVRGGLRGPGVAGAGFFALRWVGGDLAGAAGVVGCEAVSNRGKRIMGDTKKPGVDPLPGNHGQFGANVETENYETLPDLGVAEGEAAGPGAKGAGVPGGGGSAPAAGEDGAAATPGQHQVQGGMRS